jgi:hypothetical protein
VSARDRLLLTPQARAFLIIGFIWVVMAVAVNPIGEFPLNDDWSYSRAVYSLVSDGQLRFTGWQSVPLIVQVIWGAGFCKLFGFSFTTLRISTLVLGLIGVYATYVIISDLTGNAVISLIGALTIMFNPLYFELSNTFMTDVPFYCFAALSFLLLMRSIARESIFALVKGLCLACAATLIRQIGIVLTMAFGAAYVVRNGLSRRTLLTAVLPTLLIASVLMAYQTWLKAEGNLPALYNYRNDEILNTLSHLRVLLIISHTLTASVYVGLFLMPFLVIFTYSRLERSSLRYRAFYLTILFVLSILATAGLVYKQRIMPLTTNVLFDIGLGPATLRDVFILNLPHLPTAPPMLWVAVTAMGVTGAFILFHAFLSAVSYVCGFLPKINLQGGHRLFPYSKSGFDRNASILLFAVLCSSFYVLAISLFDNLFDRFLIFALMPIMVVLVLPINKGFRTFNTYPVVFCVTLLAIYGTFSTGATHDYLSWNRARWEALRHLTEGQNIPPKFIDGGFEFNGWYSYDPNYQQNPTKSWWWVYEDDYIVSFGPLAGYEEIGCYPYVRLIPPEQGTILLLHKVAGSASFSATACKL